MLFIKKKNIYNLLINIYILFFAYYSYLYASHASVDFKNIISILDNGSLYKWIIEGEVISGGIIFSLYLIMGEEGVYLFNALVIIIFLKILHYISNTEYNDLFSVVRYILLSVIIVYNPLYSDFTNQQSRQFLLLSILILFFYKEFTTKQFNGIYWFFALVVGTLIHKSAILFLFIFWISIYGITNIKLFFKLKITKSLLLIIIILVISVLFLIDKILPIIEIYTLNEENINLSIIDIVFSSLGLMISFFLTLSIVILLINQKREIKIVLISISLISTLPISIFNIGLYEILSRIYKPVMLLLVMLTLLELIKQKKLFLQLIPVLLILFLMAIILQYNKFYYSGI